MSITHNKTRVGRFTSSQIYLLIKKGRSTSFSSGALTYIKKKAYERILNRSLEIEKYSASMAWGHFLEMVVFNQIEFNWKILSNETKAINKYWAGSTDLLIEGEKVADIKCYEPFKFVDYSLCLLSKDLDRLKKDFPQEYWQLVSNAIINDVTKAEAMVFMPNLDQLEEIRQMALDYEGADAWKYRFIYERNPLDLPYIPEESNLEPLNRFAFEIPNEDIELLKNRVKEAENELQKILESK